MAKERHKLPANPDTGQSKKHPPVAQQTVLSEYRGPVPPPHILERLNQLLPTAAERIFVMAEKEQDAAIIASKNADELNLKKERNRHNEVLTSLWMAFVFSLSCLVIGGFLVYFGHEKVGIFLLSSTIVGVVGAFLNRKKLKD